MKKAPLFHIAILITFLANTFGSLPTAYADDFVLPKPGVMVHLSPEFTPAHLQGITIHPDNALQFDFLIHRGDRLLNGADKKEEYNKLVKYFLASLTIPDEDQWVNLSPYEKDRIIKDNFGKTEMGRDLLAQDYILKQITSSLIYPEEKLGRKFWETVYERAQKEYGTTNVPVNTFNKVWIVPDEAAVYESGNTCYVLRNHLKVMLEEDYLSLEKHSGISHPSNSAQNNTHEISSKIIKEIILPELQKEVNEGKNFANLRQIYSGMILATWYKHALKESLLGKVYANKAKVKGVEPDNPKANEEIYQQYLKAFKKGVFNYIKEDADKYTQEVIPRKYFSGGALDFAQVTSDVTKGFHERAVVVLKPNSSLTDEMRSKIDFAAVADEEKIDRATVALNTNNEGVAMAAPEKRLSKKGPSFISNAFRKIVLTAIVGLGLLAASPNLYGAESVNREGKPKTSFELEQESKFKQGLDKLKGKYPRIFIDGKDVFVSLRELTNDPKISILEKYEIQRVIGNLYWSGEQLDLETLEFMYNFDEWRSIVFSDIATGKYKHSGRDISPEIKDRILWVKNSEPTKKILKEFDKVKRKEGLVMTTDPTTGDILIGEDEGESYLNSAMRTLYQLAAESKNRNAYDQQIQEYLDLGLIRPLNFIYSLRTEIINNRRNPDKNDKRPLVVVVVSKLEHNRALLNSMWLLLVDLSQKNRIMYIDVDRFSQGLGLIAEQTSPIKLVIIGAHGTPTSVAFNEANKPLLELADLKKEDIDRWSQGFADKTNPDTEILAYSCGTGGCAGSNNESNVADFLKQIFPKAKVRAPKEEITGVELSEKNGDLIFKRGRKTVEEYNPDKDKPFIIPKSKAVEKPAPAPVPAKTLEQSRENPSNNQDWKEKGGYIIGPELKEDRKKGIERIEEGEIFNKDFLKGFKGLPLDPGQDNKDVPEKGKDSTKGGIDLNSANLNLQIRRDGKGVPLPLAQQDMKQLSIIQGFVPTIIDIKPAINLSILGELKEKIQ
ncbi:MAG: hypothetical protein HQL15_08910 [Candidatus Omnitrophica bacterium]|nr:hypothetical protein [Candidatus Omnitrophota bacterium]